jgi:hypothetical protein
MRWYRYPRSWSVIMLRFLPRFTLVSLMWEVLQLPLYTLWSEPSRERIAFALVHCTLGDLLIGISSLLLALLMVRAGRPAQWSRRRIGLWFMLFGTSYTVLSERINLAQGQWAYSEWMPMVPWLAIGLAPLLQWLILPGAIWWWANQHTSGLKITAT